MPYEETIINPFNIGINFFPNRSKAIQEAVSEKLHKIESNRFEIECAKLNPAFEQALADEGISSEIEEWPKY